MRYLLIFLVIGFGCKAKHIRLAEQLTVFTPDHTQGPPAIVYRAKKQYADLVPVILSDDKSRIVSYTSPDDLKKMEKLPLPTTLHEGYYLDNRGINANVAFIDMKYADYVKLTTLPALEEMYALIIDKDPLDELCDCGSRKAFRDIISQLNQLIDSEQLRKVCRVIK